MVIERKSIRYVTSFDKSSITRPGLSNQKNVIFWLSKRLVVQQIFLLGHVGRTGIIKGKQRSTSPYNSKWGIPNKTHMSDHGAPELVKNSLEDSIPLPQMTLIYARFTPISLTSLSNIHITSVK